jgi:hypothetical protein
MEGMTTMQGYHGYDIIVKVETVRRVYKSEEDAARGFGGDGRKIGTENMRAASYEDACQLASSLHTTHHEPNSGNGAEWVEIERMCTICVRVGTRVGPITIPYEQLNFVCEDLERAYNEMRQSAGTARAPMIKAGKPIAL